ncbi:K02A2.6-like [Cordylochernes scorpioides]|uniref:K02A2.6-like n=1 Tax=Cordylochernes scorpioides TaxID=51811 RepID=A0ABY6KMR0_9ARAC|nr:K02A2.6-like [Cordylochernes scorpioides]
MATPYIEPDNLEIEVPFTNIKVVDNFGHRYEHLIKSCYTSWDKEHSLFCRSQNTNSYKVKQIVGSPEPEMIQEFVIQSVENTNLTEDWYEEVKIKGHRIPVEGQSLAMCMVKNMTAYIRFIISRDNTCPILGRQTCSNLGLVKRVNTCQAITQEYQELFEGIGCLKGYEYEAKFQTSDMNMQIAVNLHGSKYFTKLDLKKGYWQIKVAPNSQRYFTFSTPWGRYMFLRVPFGIKTAPEIFQKIMADLLQDLEGTENSMDDILIHAPDPQTLEIRTRAVLQRLKENGIKLNRDKCKFQLQEIQFLGHIVTTEGIKIDPEKVRAIGEIKSPSNKQELQRLLGMVQYLSRFIPNLAEKTKNMRLLLKKDTPWLWDESLDCDLLEIKTLLRTAPTMKFFNPNGNLTLSVDASSYALGAVLLQNGKPIAYASSALNSTQQNYAQIEKEALAIKFGCDKFHQLIYGKTVDVETDHRPLETIFKKPLSKAPPRLQRIFLQIQQYDLRIKYKKGKELLTADLLSRDCSYEDTYLEENFEVLMTTPTNKSSYEELQTLTKEDQELQELKTLILYGWPNYKSAVPESCKKYWPYRDELSTNEDLIFKGSRVFIPLRLLETDNGPNFTSRDFKDFQKKWLFDHQTSSPLYPKSNGLAERAVQTAKNLIRKCLDSGQEVELALLNFYNTPRDGLPSPAQCLFSRRTRTLLPTSTHQLEPEIQKGHTQNLRNKREKQKTHHDKTAKTTRSFKEGENIMLKQHHREWIPARVTQEVAPRSYKVQTPTGEYRRNSSFMRHTNLESPKQQRRRIPEIPKSTLPEGPGPSGDKEQAQVPEELNTSPRAFTGQEPRSDHQNAEHKNGTLPITTRKVTGGEEGNYIKILLDLEPFQYFQPKRVIEGFLHIHNPVLLPSPYFLGLTVLPGNAYDIYIRPIYQDWDEPLWLYVKMIMILFLQEDVIMIRKNSSPKLPFRPKFILITLVPNIGIFEPFAAYNITDLIKENPRTTLLELEQDTGISKTTIGKIVTEDLKLKKTPAKCIPRFLTNKQNLCRLATCEDMFKMTRTDPEWKDKIITGDEKWVYGYDPETKRQSAEWRGQDIAPNDFFLFPKLKAVLKGRHFDTREDIIEKSLLALKSIPKAAYKNCFDNWEKRWR